MLDGDASPSLNKAMLPSFPPLPPPLCDGRLFTPLARVAVWISYEHVCSPMRLHNVSY